MKTITIYGAKDLRIDTHEEVEPAFGEVNIELARGGICGSDLHYYNHGGFGAVRLREPMILGHEVSGYITKLGEGVEGLRTGQLVAVSPSRPCHDCIFCKAAQYNQCLHMRFYGSAMPFPHIQGAFREVLTVKAEQCAVADGLLPEEAVMAEPLAVTLHAAKQAGNLLGKSVLVTGCGPIGQLCILSAQCGGASEIVATDLSDFTTEMALGIGANEAVNIAKNPDFLEQFAREKGHFDVHFECSGSAAAVNGAITVLRPGAVIVQLGLGGDMTLPIQAITAKEITLKGSFRFHEEFFLGVEMMRQGLIDVNPLVTHHFALEDATAAFEMAGNRAQSMKTQIRFNGCA